LQAYRGSKNWVEELGYRKCPPWSSFFLTS
jgi:hypothetical protein